MKNLVLIIATLFVATFQLTASNIAPSSSLSIYSSDRSIVLHKTGLMTDANTMTLSDDSGVVIYTHKIKSDNKTIKYDLRGLPNGTYTIEINGNDMSEIHEATINDETIILATIDTYHSPVLSVNNEKVMINLESNNPEDISYLIYDYKGNLVYDYTEMNAGTLNKVFNLEQLESGKYRIYASTDHFSQNIWVNL